MDAADQERTVHVVESATPRSVRRRRRLAASLLSWALTLASLATLAGGVLLAMTASPTLSASMAQQPGVRLEAATWVLSVVESTTGAPAKIAPHALADALDDAALADLLGANITGIFTDQASREVPLSSLAPSVPAEKFGLPPGSDLKLLPVLPDVSWLPAPLTWSALIAAALAALLGLAAMFTAYSHQRSYVVARLGRWLLSACGVVAMVYGAALFAGPSAGLLGAYAAAVAEDAARRGAWVLIAGVVAGALLLLLAGALRHSHARRVSAQVDTVEPRLPVAPAATPAAGHAALTPATTPVDRIDPSWSLPPLPVAVRPSLAPPLEQAPSPTPHWARPGWPQSIEPFAASEITREATEAELEHAATSSCRAWVAGTAADPDDAEILQLLLADRGNFVQLARLWARYDGLPRACANVVLAYTDLSLHIQEYSELLDIPDWAMHNRVGTLRRGVQDKGVDRFANDLRAVYVELAGTLTEPLAARERTRLTQIADALRFASAGAPA